MKVRIKRSDNVEIETVAGPDPGDAHPFDGQIAVQDGIAYYLKWDGTGRWLRLSDVRGLSWAGCTWTEMKEQQS